MTDPRAWFKSVEAHLATGDPEMIRAVVREVADEVSILAARLQAAGSCFGGVGAVVPEDNTPEAAFLRFRQKANREREG